jgi:rare lipoprotein A
LQSLTKGFLLFVMLLLVGFTILNEQGKVNQPKSNNSQESTVVDDSRNETFNSEAKPILQFNDRGRMTASWYGPRFHGRLTANGEIYNQLGFTAAHRSFKFGTLLKLTNPRNNKTVIVRINDRGPYIKGRELDLSRGAAIALGLVRKGIIKLKVEEVALADESRPLLALN